MKQPLPHIQVVNKPCCYNSVAAYVDRCSNTVARLFLYTGFEGQQLSIHSLGTGMNSQMQNTPAWVLGNYCIHKQLDLFYTQILIVSVCSNNYTRSILSPYSGVRYLLYSTLVFSSGCMARISLIQISLFLQGRKASCAGLSPFHEGICLHQFFIFSLLQYIQGNQLAKAGKLLK